METLVIFFLSIVFIIIGVLNRKGHISMMHSYHRKRVSEEDRLPFGKLVGNGMLIIAASMTVFGVLSLVAKSHGEIYMTVGGVVMIIGTAVGVVLAFYAMIKYNKGIF